MTTIRDVLRKDLSCDQPLTFTDMTGISDRPHISVYTSKGRVLARLIRHGWMELTGGKLSKTVNGLMATVTIQQIDTFWAGDHQKTLIYPASQALQEAVKNPNIYLTSRV